MADLAYLQSEYGVSVVAAVVDPEATRLAGFRFPSRVALLVGGGVLRPDQPLSGASRLSRDDPDEHQGGFPESRGSHGDLCLRNDALRARPAVEPRM